MVGRRGLRHGGGTSITRCCGREAIIPSDPDSDYVSETDEGTPIDTDEFPVADLVCAGCGRTWPESGCDHDHLSLVTQDFETDISGDSDYVDANCRDCGEAVQVLLDVGDVRVK